MERTLGEAAALLSALTWAATSIVMAGLAARYHAAVLTGIQFAVASVVLTVLLFATGHAVEVAEASSLTVLAMIAAGLVGYGIGDTTYVRALPRLGVQRVAPTATALWVTGGALGGVLLLGEPGGWRLVAGGVAAAAGTYLVLSRAGARGIATRASRWPANVGLAPLALAIVPAAWVCSTLLVAGARGNLGALSAGTIRVAAGAIVLLAAIAGTHRGSLWGAMPRGRDLALTLAVGVIGSAGGSLLYTFAVAYAGAARTVILGSLSPLLALPLAMVFLGERPTVRIGAGTVLCVAGALLVVGGA